MVRHFSKDEKDEIVAEIRLDFAKRYPAGTSHKSCLHYSMLTCRALIRRGERAIIQAGTCCWPRLRPDQDDGVSFTHYSFQWEPDSPQSIMAMLNGNLPEMHVWAALPETEDIIDVTTGSLPKHALEHGLDWPGDPPPDYFWDRSPPANVIYSPDIEAIRFALHVAQEIANVDRTSKRSRR